MATNTQFNFTAYLEQPTPWQNEPASIRGIVITVTVSRGILMSLYLQPQLTAQLIALFCVISRLYIRLAVLRMPGWDDIFVGLYLVSFFQNTYLRPKQKLNQM